MEKKKSIKKGIFSVLVVLLVAAMVIIPFALEKLQEDGEDKGSVLSAVASAGSVSKTVSGAGILTDEKAVEVKLPYGVEVTKYFVNNYDFVKEGQPLVRVDPVTVMTSIKEYQRDIDYVETQMARYTDTGATNFLTTASAGRVMELYAKAGDSINDVMLEHGALAVLSLDGLLAVDIENNTIPVNSSVNIITHNSHTVPGRVESRKDGVITVTLSQDDRAVGETVKVQSKDGEMLGSGELYVHSPLKITGYTGTIEAVHVKINQDMFQGGTVFTYSGNSGSAEYEVYAAKHEELTDYMEKLFKMYTDGTINAECTGVVSGIDEAAAELLAAKGEPEAALDFLVSRGDRPQVMTTTAVEELPVEERIGLPEETNEELSEETPVEGPEEDNTARTEENPDIPPEGESDIPVWPNCPTSEDESGQTPEGESFPEGEDEQPTEGEDQPTAESEGIPYYRIGRATNVVQNLDDSTGTTGTIYYVLSADKFYSMNEVKTALQNILLINWGKAEYLNFPDSRYSVTMNNVPADPEDPDAADDAKNRFLLALYDGTLTPTAEENKRDLSVIDKDGNTVSSGGGEGGGGGSGSGSTAGMNGSSAKVPSYEYYSTKQSEVMAVTPQDFMTVDITVDELDILSIQRGQEVQITLDALTGQSFDGVITDIGVSGSNSGGNSKYIAEVTIDRASNMIAGMNATALITLSTSENLVTIPTEALVCEGPRTYVYTGYDSKNDVLLNPVDVTTGASDGIVTEIISGLKEGDTVWYTYLDKLDNGFDFPAMQPPANMG